MPRTFLLPAGQRPDDTAPGRVVHRYPAGGAAVELPTSAEPPLEAQPAGRLRLEAPGATKAALSAARRSIRDAGARSAADSAAEAGRDVTAYVEFVAPADPRWLEQLGEAGVAVLAYQPENSYLVRGSAGTLAGLPEAIRTSEGASAVRSVTELQGPLKQLPATVAEAGETAVVVLAAAPDERAATTRALGQVPGVTLLPGAGNDVLDGQRIRVRVRLRADGLAALRDLPHVLSVEPFGTAVPEDEVACLVLAGQLDPQGRPSGSYETWLTAKDLDGDGAVIGIVDGGVDATHPAFAGRIRDLTGGRKDWHATMVAGHAAGDYRDERDDDGFVYGLGTAPGAVLLSQDRGQSGRALCEQTVAEADGAVAIQNNSWGRTGANPMDYGSEEALYDALVRASGPTTGTGARGVPLTVCFSSGNSGAAGLTRPKAAKNVIVTGNSENFRPEAGGAESDDVRQVYSGSNPSSRGNCGDGRIRPHVVAPGEWTSSAAYDVHPGELEYVSPRITWGGGSSGASPKTAGACALLAQWWRRWHGGDDPSPAMLRALVVNGAEPILADGPPPNNTQGWGRLSLRELLDPSVARIAVDQSEVLTGTGLNRSWPIRVADPHRPVKITLAWTDPPGGVGTGTAGASAVVNRLALRLQQGGRTWRGGADRFAGGWTLDDAALAGRTDLRPDGADNLQCIFLAPGTFTAGTVSVTALALAADGVDGGFDRPRQDFALVVTNAAVDHTTGPTPVVAGVAAGGSGSSLADSEHLASPAEEDWWGEGLPVVNPLDAAEESLRSRSAALHAAGVRVDVVDRFVEGVENGLAEAASAVRARLLAEQPTGLALLGVPAGTPVTDAAVEAVRALAGLTEVRLVGDDAQLLASLVTAVGPHPRVRHRSTGAGGFAAGLAEASRELAGLQRLTLFPVTQVETRVEIDVTGRDTALLLSLPTGAYDATLTAPDGQVHALAGTDPVVEAVGERPGRWVLSVTLDDAAQARAIAGWVRGGIDLTVTVPEVAADRRLLRVEAPDGALLERLSIRRGDLAGRPDHPDGLAAEADRPVVVRARTSRLAQLAQAVEALDDGASVAAPESGDDTVAVPALAHTVEVGRVDPTGAELLDIPVEVVGVTADGYRFARTVHASVTAVPEPSGARAGAGTRGPSSRHLPAPPPLRVIARIVGVDGTAVTVTDGRRTRVLVVRSDVLLRAVQALDRTRPVALAVRGAELLSVYLSL